MSGSTGEARRWPQIRAGLILFAIVVGLVDGCPLPPPRHVKAWQQGMVDVIRPIQQAVMTPFRWVTRGLRFSQRWALMQAAARERYRFTAEGRDASGAWTVLYRASDSAHAAFAEILEEHHVVGTINPTDQTMGQYPAFVRRFTDRVLDERADLAAVRTSFEKVIIGDGRLRGTGEFVVVMTRERGVK